MPTDSRTYYQILQVHHSASFEELKKAYRAMAKQCHPDLFGNSPEKTAEFQTLVQAFNILSDPESRAEYDRRLAFENAPLTTDELRSTSIMDTVADDILEEMVVGNDIDRLTTLMTLMLDLEHTEKFIKFRQAKTFFFGGDYHKCMKLCESLVDASPCNILYHYYLGESARLLGKSYKAAKHFRICLEQGYSRTPPQRLSKVRRHYRAAQQNKGLLGKFMAWLMGEEEAPQPTEEEKMRRALEAAFDRDEQKRRGRTLHKGKEIRRLRQ